MTGAAVSDADARGGACCANLAEDDCMPAIRDAFLSSLDLRMRLWAYYWRLSLLVKPPLLLSWRAADLGGLAIRRLVKSCLRCCYYSSVVGTTAAL